MAIPHPRAFRLTEDDLARIEALSIRWGGVEPLSAAGVIREALRRAADGPGPAPKTKTRKRVAGEDGE